MGKSTISMAIFNSYVKLPEGKIILFEICPNLIRFIQSLTHRTSFVRLVLLIYFWPDLPYPPYPSISPIPIWLKYGWISSQQFGWNPQFGWNITNIFPWYPQFGWNPHIPPMCPWLSMAHLLQGAQDSQPAPACSRSPVEADQRKWRDINSSINIISISMIIWYHICHQYISSVYQCIYQCIPSGELTYCYGKIHHAINGKIHYFDWAIFHCFLYVHQRVAILAMSPNPAYHFELGLKFGVSGYPLSRVTQIWCSILRNSRHEQNHLWICFT